MRAVDPRTGRLYRVVDLARRFKPPRKMLQQARLDNLALLPASLLPFKAEYQAIANQQPPGTVLVVLPAGDTIPRRTLEQVATRMRATGQSVRIISSAACTSVRYYGGGEQTR